MRPARLIGLVVAALVLAALLQVVLLAPVQGNPDRGILPPVDQQAPMTPQ